MVLSLGARGALLATPTETRRFAAIPVTAAAEAWAQATAWSPASLCLLRGWTMIEAVKFGMAAGAAALVRPGAELCRSEDTQRLYRTIVGNN